MPSTLNGFSIPQWGVQCHAGQGSYGTAADQYAHAAACGATIVRDDLSWAYAEGGASRPGAYSWSAIDVRLDQAAANGLKLIAQIGFCPQWASGSSNDKVPPTSGNYQYFGDYARALVLHAKARVPGTLIAIEIWNEPNLDGFFVGQSETVYAALAEKVYDTVRGISPAAADADPTVEIWGGSTAGAGDKNTWNNWLWLTNVIAAGVLAHVDAWSCHPYQWDTDMTGADMTNEQSGNGFSRIFAVSGSGANLADRLAAAGFTGYVHGTEWGAPTHAYPSGNVPRGTSEQNQEDLFRLGWPKWKAHARAGHLIWYENRDRLSSNTTDPEYHFGCWRSDYSQKPVMTAMADLPNSNEGGGGGPGAQTFDEWIQNLSGLIGYWKCDDTASPLQPTVGAVTLAASGSGFTYAVAGLTGDSAEKAVRVNGSGFFSDGDNFDFPVKAPYTIGMLFKPSALDAGAYYILAAKRVSATGKGYEFWINNLTGTMRASHSRLGDALDQSSILSPASDLAIGSVVLVLLSYDGTTIMTYINEHSHTAPGTEPKADNAANFGFLGGGSGVSAKGDASHLFILNRGITDLEVAAGVAAITVAPGTEEEVVEQWGAVLI